MKTNNKMPAGDYKISRNVRGKKTKDPGFKPGDHWVQCDRCASAVRASDAMLTWDNLVVCPDDWEIRHPQDFVRGRADDIAAKGITRSESQDVFIEKPCEIKDSALPGEAIPGCAIPGFTSSSEEIQLTSSIPTGTFQGSPL